MATMGRPKKPINWKQVDKMLFIQCTCEEIAGVLGIHADTLADRCKEEHGITYSEYSHNGRQLGKMSLRRSQFKLAERNASMAIWLGKNTLKQKDNLELSGPNGGPIPVTHLEMVAPDLPTPEDE